MNVTIVNLCKVRMQYFGHGRPGDIGALSGQPTFCQVATGMLRVGHIDITDNIHDATIGLLRQTLILAAVACFHVENGDMQTFGTDYT